MYIFNYMCHMCMYKCEHKRLNLLRQQGTKLQTLKFTKIDTAYRNNN